MQNISINQLEMFSLEALIVASLVLGLFRLRSRFGLSPLYVTLGVFQPIQVLLASSIYAEVIPGVVVSPGSVIMFTASLFAILLVYIREDAIEARKVIYGGRDHQPDHDFAYLSKPRIQEAMICAE